MTSRDILALAAKIAEQYGRSPFCAAEAEGIGVAFYPFRKLPGMYGVVADQPFIALKTGLAPGAARVICAHELGHHFLHRAVAAGGFFKESVIFGGAGRLEQEANLFAAEFLLSDEEVLPSLRYGISAEAIAEELAVPPELIALKAQALRLKGIHIQPNTPPARFLSAVLSRKMEV